VQEHQSLYTFYKHLQLTGLCSRFWNYHSHRFLRLANPDTEIIFLAVSWMGYIDRLAIVIILLSF